MDCAICPDREARYSCRTFDLDSWNRSANAGCLSCKLIRDAALAMCDGQVFTIIYTANYDGFVRLEIDHGSDRFRETSRMDLLTDDERVVKELRCVKKVTYPIDGTFFSRLGLERAGLWLDHCLRNHPTCGTSDTRVPLPTRLVAVGSLMQNPYLYVTKPGEKGNYATLSYCWGNSKTFTTTTPTLDARRGGFLLEELPNICRDAVLLTRVLGIPYIWIDQLCILQEGPGDDWERESAKMHSIYANSVITLAALSSPGSDSGIFGLATHIRPSAAIEVQLPNKGGTSTVYARRFIRRGYFSFMHSETLDEPAFLENRLWTLQEVALSRRVLWLGLGDIGWSCKESTACACEPLFVPLTSHNNIPSHVTVNLAPTAKLTRKEWLHIWYQYVEEATQRLVTKESDRLPALAGLAAAMRQHIDGRYIAGHWETDIEQSLLWGVLNPEKFRHEQISTAAPMRQDYAPSWSWASVSRPMEHDGAFASDTLEVNMDCKVLDIQFRPSTLNQYGPGVGVLKMECIALRVVRVKNHRTAFEHRPEGKELQLVPGWSQWHADWRGDSTPWEDRDLYMVIHSRWPDDDEEPDEIYWLAGLILEKVGEGDFEEWEERFCSLGRGTAGGEEEIGDSACLEREDMRRNVFRRVGVTLHFFRQNGVKWEELKEEYKRTIWII